MGNGYRKTVFDGFFVLHADQMVRNLVRCQHLCFSLVAGKHNDLAFISIAQPLQSGFQPTVIVQHEAVIENQRHLILAGLDQLGGGETER